MSPQWALFIRIQSEHWLLGKPALDIAGVPNVRVGNVYSRLWAARESGGQSASTAVHCVCSDVISYGSVDAAPVAECGADWPTACWYCTVFLSHSLWAQDVLLVSIASWTVKGTAQVMSSRSCHQVGCLLLGWSLLFPFNVCNVLTVQRRNCSSGLQCPDRSHYESSANRQQQVNHSECIHLVFVQIEAQKIVWLFVLR